MLASWHFFCAQALKVTHFCTQEQRCYIPAPSIRRMHCQNGFREKLQRALPFLPICSPLSNTPKQKKYSCNPPSSASWLEAGKSPCRELTAGFLPSPHSRYKVCDLCINNICLVNINQLNSRQTPPAPEGKKSSGLFNGIKGCATHLISQITSSTAKEKASCSTVILFIVIHDITLKEQWFTLLCK